MFKHKSPLAVATSPAFEDGEPIPQRPPADGVVVVESRQPVSRRRALQLAAGLGVLTRISDSRAWAADAPSGSPLGPYGAGTLPAGVRARMVRGVNGLDVNVLEAGFERTARPMVLLLHGYPDLAYGWRKVMPMLAAAGYHVVAPDQRGFGRTTGWDGAYDTDLEPFSLLNMVRDALALVEAFGRTQIAAVVGHDAGSLVAAWCALIRPDVFRSAVLMSAPFGGPPSLPVGTALGAAKPPADPSDQQTLAAGLAALLPPRKYYQDYYRTRQANDDMLHAPQGLHEFLRAYFYVKSADWPHNRPHPLAANTAAALAELPKYYVMDLNRTMAETVGHEMPTPAQVAASTWLTEAELNVYVAEYGRTGFQGGLQAYRVYTDPKLVAELTLYAGGTIDVPAVFMSGRSDWGACQSPGALEAMQVRLFTRMQPVQFIDGAGHWVQQEQADQVASRLIAFLRRDGAG